MPLQSLILAIKLCLTLLIPITPSPDTIATYLCTLIEDARYSDYIGESISQESHALQAAYLASLYSPKDKELILAALFHDIAHLLKEFKNLNGDKFGVFHHGPIGAYFLRSLGFSEKVCLLVQEHATAKRYLTRDSKYYNTLSYASQQTLIQQGGVMSAKEAEEFEKHLYFKELIAIRYADDGAKDPNAQVPPLEHYKNLIIEHLNRENL